MTPETARLLQHWRHHKFAGIRPFFCQIEAVETAIKCARRWGYRVKGIPDEAKAEAVIVAASAPHRGEAFAGARALIDRVKAEAPIWKVEVTDAGRRRVEGVLPPT